MFIPVLLTLEHRLASLLLYTCHIHSALDIQAIERDASMTPSKIQAIQVRLGEKTTLPSKLSGSRAFSAFNFSKDGCEGELKKDLGASLQARFG